MSNQPSPGNWYAVLVKGDRPGDDTWIIRTRQGEQTNAPDKAIGWRLAPVSEGRMGNARRKPDEEQANAYLIRGQQRGGPCAVGAGRQQGLVTSGVRGQVGSWLRRLEERGRGYNEGEGGTIGMKIMESISRLCCMALWQGGQFLFCRRFAARSVRFTSHGC